jgi:signal transduction histidine kinase
VSIEVVAIHTLVNINRTEIQQVVLNLINNAIQALAESRSNAKTLKIESHDVADGVEILITDNGPGIPMEAQSHLFELLADSNKKTGMGLGLWLCRHIITRHGGNIGYQDAKGGGAQFGIFLPSSPNLLLALGLIAQSWIALYIPSITFIVFTT